MNRSFKGNDANLARAMGILNGSKATNSVAFGADYGDDYGADMGVDTPSYYGYNTAGFGDDVGFGGRRRHRAAGGAPAVQQLLSRHHHEQMATARRESLLHPNKNSKIDIERYDFSLSQSIVIGTAAILNQMSLQPSVTVRPQRCAFNAPSFGFATISSILVANVNALQGGATDAAIYSANSFGVHLDLPTLSPANKLSINGQYTGLTPPGFPVSFGFLFVASFQCPATVVA